MSSLGLVFPVSSAVIDSDLVLQAYWPCWQDNMFVKVANRAKGQNLLPRQDKDKGMAVPAKGQLNVPALCIVLVLIKGKVPASAWKDNGVVDLAFRPPWTAGMPLTCGSSTGISG